MYRLKNPKCFTLTRTRFLPMQELQNKKIPLALDIGYGNAEIGFISNRYETMQRICSSFLKEAHYLYQYDDYQRSFIIIIIMHFKEREG